MTISTLKLMFIATFFLPLTLFAEEAIEMNPYGQYFEDSDGLVSIEAAMLEEKNEHGLNDMIMIMHGFAPYEAGIDNKPILYKGLSQITSPFHL